MKVFQGMSYAWRSLRRAPVFSAAVVLTLTIGIGAATAIFAVVNAVLLQPLPFGKPDRLVGVWFDMPAMNLIHTQQTQGTYFTFKKFSQTIEDMGVYQEGTTTLTDPDGHADPERISVGWTTASVFPILQVSPILGRTYDANEDAPKGPNVVVLSEGLWRARFGADKNIVGRKITLAGRAAEVIGVMPEKFRFPGSGTKVWMPLQLDPNAPFSSGFNYNSVARLKAGVTVDAAERELNNVLPRVTEVAPMIAPSVTMKYVLDQAKPKVRVYTMRDDIVGESSKALWMVAATALLVLLVTCANVANLMLVRADGRQRELSVRAALGAGQSRVLAHFFTESGLLAAISAVLGIGAAAVGIHFLVESTAAQIPRLAEVHVGWMVVAFAILIAALAALACSALPAIRFMRGNMLAGLRDGGRSGTVGRNRQRARGALVAAQMAFALVVLAGSGLLLRSFQHLKAVKPGFNADGLATLWVSLPRVKYPSDSSRMRFYAELVDRAHGITGIKSVGITSHLPLQQNGSNNDPFFVEGDAASMQKIPPLEIHVTADSGYFSTMGIPLIAGRNFDRLERQSGDESIISQETARFFFHDSTGRSAIGKRFQILPNGPWHTIIGVVGSVRDTSLSGPPARTVYHPQTVAKDTIQSGTRSTMAIVARTSGDINAATRSLQALVREMDPSLPTFDVRSMRATADASIARLTFTMTILGVAAAVTLLLGAIGLYGVIAYIVTLRTRELGVRIALGAQPRTVATMVTRQGLVLSGTGLAVGLVIVTLAARFLRSFLFEIAPTDPVTLGGASATLIAFALLASWLPARRAANVNPMEALRSD